MKEHIEELLALLGPAVLLPIPKGRKGPIFGGWQNQTLERMGDTKYQERLNRAKNLGVLLGSPSHGLCSIDIDDDESVKPFLLQNPRLQDSLRTKGNRGCNVWVRLIGEYPKLTKLKTFDGKPWGEWRSDGGQTVIWGLHPEGMDYQIVVHAAPVEISYEEIVFPEGEGLNKSTMQRVPKEATLPVSPAVDGARIAASIKAQEVFEANNPRLSCVYDQLVRSRVRAMPGRRNTALVELTAFLYRAVGYEVAKLFIGQFYSEGQNQFNDSFDQHIHEFDSMWASLDRDYHESLNVLERDVYLAFVKGVEKEAFRICRDLSNLDPQEYEAGQFYISNDHLGLRLKIQSSQANRILRKFVNSGILKIEVPGVRRERGKPCKATVYRWCLLGCYSEEQREAA